MAAELLHRISQDSATEGTLESKGRQVIGDHDSYGSQAPSASSSTWSSDEYPPLDLNYDALRHIASCYLPGKHGDCTEITTMVRGSFNEIRLLTFEDGWSCIGRFARDDGERLEEQESTYATMKHVREHTTIPVPEVYFTNFDPANTVGAPFVLMERMSGTTYYHIWKNVTVEQKCAVAEQLADVLLQLANLRFDKIGSLDANGKLGRLFDFADSLAGAFRGPFDTMETWLLNYIIDVEHLSAEAQCDLAVIRNRIKQDLAEKQDDAIYNPPFRLLHPDFNGQNLLFDWPDKSLPPKLSAVLDWDGSHTGPLYYLFEYPIFFQDVDWSEDEYEDNKKVRKHFVRKLVHSFARGSADRMEVRECFRQKNYLYNAFYNTFATTALKEDDREGTDLPSSIACPIKSFREGIEGSREDLCGHQPYNGRLDWEPDSEVESEDEETSEVRRD